MESLLKSERCFANEYTEELYEWIKENIQNLDADLKVMKDNCPTHRNTKIEVIYPNEESREKYTLLVEGILEDALHLYQI